LDLAGGFEFSRQPVTFALVVKQPFHREQHKRKTSETSGNAQRGGSDGADDDFDWQKREPNHRAQNLIYTKETIESS
jgi:hypothetical protein